jgi:replication factor A1
MYLMAYVSGIEGNSYKINRLREGLENIVVVGRVLESTQPRTIQTKKGVRTISTAVIGDETGRVKLTLWGRLAGALKVGDVIKVSNAWTTSYKGEVQLNAGSKSSIEVIKESENFPKEDEIPENRPKAFEEGGYGERRGFRSKQGFRRSRGEEE